MEDKHDDGAPGLDAVVRGLEELEVVLGPEARPLLGKVRDALLQAMAARARSDTPAAARALGDAMQAMTRLAERLDPAEAALMRSAADSFRSALLRGDVGSAREGAAFMMQRSGAVERKKP